MREGISVRKSLNLTGFPTAGFEQVFRFDRRKAVNASQTAQDSHPKTMETNCRRLSLAQHDNRSLFQVGLPDSTSCFNRSIQSDLNPEYSTDDTWGELSSHNSDSGNGWSGLFAFFIRWANRPKLSLHGVFYATGYLRRVGDAAGLPTGIYFVFVELWNTGRNFANDPVIGTQAFLERVPLAAELSGNMESDIAILDSIIGQVSSIKYDATTDDDLANQFLKEGLEKVQYLSGSKQGKKFLFGFAFEDGRKFYMPSKQSIETQSLPIGDGKDRFMWFQSQARNSRPKVIAKNVKLTLPKWNEIKLHYRDREVDIAGREEGQEDSDDSRSGQDNRERILQDKIVELEWRVASLERQSTLLFIIGLSDLLLALGLWSLLR